MLDGLQYEIVPAEPGDTKGASLFVVCKPPQAVNVKTDNSKNKINRILNLNPKLY